MQSEMMSANSTNAPLTGKLSVAIISFNEENNIVRCLESVRHLAAEIMVVDSHSTDRTVEIARSLGAQVFVEEWKGHVGQKNSALDKCSCEWILSIDCDEVVSEELAASISRALARGGDADGYRINRKTFFLGRWIEHAWYPDFNMRLIRRDSGRWQGLDPHDNLVVPGKNGTIDGDMYHYSFKDMRDFFDRTVRYAAIECKSYDRADKKAGLSKLLVNPLYGFFKHYVLKRGFLDGLPGFIIAVTNGIYIFMKYALLWEVQRDRKNNG
jgi:glycosyltransferase involved in cell wall biosynthesis